MRIVTVLLLGLALYFAAGVLWPARYEGPRYVPPAAADSPAMRALRARPLPADDNGDMEVVAELSALQQPKDLIAYARWMQARTWWRFLGRDEPALANVGAAIEAGREAEAALPALRAEVLAKVVAVRVETALAPAFLERYEAGEDMSRGRVLNAVTPGLWSIDVERHHDFRAAVNVRNLASAPIASTRLAPLRLVVSWDGERDKSLRCEPDGSFELGPGLEVTIWCESMAGLGWKTAREPIDWIRSGTGNDDHRVELVSSESSLAIPALDLVVRRGGNEYRTPELDRAADLARHRAGERSCFARGTCTREMFGSAGHWRAALAWALAALGVCVTAGALGHSFALAVPLAVASTFNAGARALVAAANDAHPFPLWRSLFWLATCFALAALAWSLRAPLSDWRSMQSRPRPDVIYARWSVAAGTLGSIGVTVYGAFVLWLLWTLFVH
jgi:hypothetical protein